MTHISIRLASLKYCSILCCNFHINGQITIGQNNKDSIHIETEFIRVKPLHIDKYNSFFVLHNQDMISILHYSKRTTLIDYMTS